MSITSLDQIPAYLNILMDRACQALPLPPFREFSIYPYATHKDMYSIKYKMDTFASTSIVEFEYNRALQKVFSFGVLTRDYLTTLSLVNEYYERKSTFSNHLETISGTKSKFMSSYEHHAISLVSESGLSKFAKMLPVPVSC